MARVRSRSYFVRSFQFHPPSAGVGVRAQRGSDDRGRFVPGDGDSDESVLATRLCDGDPAALEALMQRYFDSLTRFAYYLVGSRDAAEDVVQEVFVRLWEQRATVDPSRSLRAFLFRSVRNQALNDLKHRHVRERYQALVADEAAHDEAVGTVPSGEDALLTHATYEAGVRALSPRHQQVLRLRLEEQLSYAELAEALELSSKAAEQLFLRALTALRRRLHEKSRP